MKVFKNIKEIRSWSFFCKDDGKKVGFVPTMGALHTGHLSLIELAQQHVDEVAVSIYVNPEQFGPDEDFKDYPRKLKTDLEKCEKQGVSAVFTPRDERMYGSEQFLKIDIDELNNNMDGASRAGFFEGIVLVVNKLFNIIEPDIAVFGQKDIQQFRILQQMVQEFNHDVELLMGPIIRAGDGLALSSRNAYLSQKERKTAPALYRSLRYLHKQIKAGVTNLKLPLQHQRSELEAKGLKIDYLNVFTLDRITPLEELKANCKYIVGGAFYVGETRLIDNIIIET